MIKAAILRDWWWTPPREREEQNPAEILLHALTRQEKAKVEDVLHVLVQSPDGREGIRTNRGSRKYLLCKYGLHGWKNITGEDGKQIQFAPLEWDGSCPDKNLDVLPDWLITEAANEIERGCELSEDDRKNSEPGPGDEPSAKN